MISLREMCQLILTISNVVVNILVATERIGKKERGEKMNIETIIQNIRKADLEEKRVQKKNDFK